MYSRHLYLYTTFHSYYIALFSLSLSFAFLYSSLEWLKSLALLHVAQRQNPNNSNNNKQALQHTFSLLLPNPRNNHNIGYLNYIYILQSPPDQSITQQSQIPQQHLAHRQLQFKQLTLITRHQPFPQIIKPSHNYCVIPKALPLYNKSRNNHNLTNNNSNLLPLTWLAFH